MKSKSQIGFVVRLFLMISALGLSVTGLAQGTGQSAPGPTGGAYSMEPIIWQIPPRFKTWPDGDTHWGLCAAEAKSGWEACASATLAAASNTQAVAGGVAAANQDATMSQAAGGMNVAATNALANFSAMKSGCAAGLAQCTARCEQSRATIDRWLTAAPAFVNAANQTARDHQLNLRPQQQQAALAEAQKMMDDIPTGQSALASVRDIKYQCERILGQQITLATSGMASMQAVTSGALGVQQAVDRPAATRRPAARPTTTRPQQR